MSLRMGRSPPRCSARQLVVVALSSLFVTTTGCGGAIVHTRGDAAGLIPNVTTVLALPPRLSFGRLGDQRRTARRTGDTMIQASGGHAILSEELPSTDPELIAEGLRGLGEDPEKVLTFSFIAARTVRAESTAMGTVRTVRHFADYVVRLDVRRADSPDVLGSIETFATAFANAPEVDEQGRPVGLQHAIDQAVVQAMGSFAPRLIATEPFPTVAEVPLRSEGSAINGALAAVDKLRKLQVLYPEVSTNDLAALASSSARFLIVNPGRLAALGVARGDLVNGLLGQNLGGRAAFARTLARGDTPGLSIDRGGKRLLVGQTLVAKKH